MLQLILKVGVCRFGCMAVQTVYNQLLLTPAALNPAGTGPEGQTCSSVAGTHFYMSPEQMAGVRRPRDQIQKLDVFALGVTFFELCCPFSTDMERFKVC